MIVTDLDGTLLRRDKTISDYTAGVFERCRGRNIRIVLATARPIRAVEMLKLNIRHDACAYHNGAVIAVGGVVVEKTGIRHAAAKALLCEAKQFPDMRIAVEMNDALYANFDASEVWPGVAFAMTDFSDLPESPTDKMIFITAEKQAICGIERLFDDTLYGEVAENEILMVMNKNARKRNAVRDIADRFGIPLGDVAAFGDDYNDMEMLRDCGVGVAVENAIGEAKAAADFICPGNDEDGVAKWIESHVL